MTILNRTTLYFILTGFIILLFPGLIFCDESLEVGSFSKNALSEQLPINWEPLRFKKIEKETRYSLVIDDDLIVIKADSNAAASGLMRRILIDPKKYPVVEWRWKVSNIYSKGDVTKKSGDDYPARLYITFEYDKSRVNLMERAKYKIAGLVQGEMPPLCAINYIWESKAPVGLVTPNPYTQKVMMITVESGTSKLDQWVIEKRNVYEDFKNIFGYEPPLINSVAIMTDSDNTGESATAYYGDIRFMKE